MSGTLEALRAEKSDRFEDWVVAINSLGATSAGAVLARSRYRSSLDSIQHHLAHGPAVDLWHVTRAPSIGGTATSASDLAAAIARDPKKADGIAAHEAWHVIANLARGRSVEKAELVIGRDSAGPFIVKGLTHAERWDDISLVAGAVGVQMMRGKDYPAAWLSEGAGGDAGALGAIHPAMRQGAERAARAIVRSHWWAGERICAALLKHGELNEQQLRALM